METKEAWPGAFLFFQIGDFFELFFEDAEAAAPLLDLALTSRQKIDGEPVPMCGVPLAAGDLYVNRLASMGHRVVVYEQEDPAPSDGRLARRRLARVVTPGTVVAEDGTPAGRYMAVILHEGSLPAPQEAEEAARLAWHERESEGHCGPVRDGSGGEGSGPAREASGQKASCRAGGVFRRQRRAARDSEAAASAGPASSSDRSSGSSSASASCSFAASAPAPAGGWWYLAAADLSTGDFQLARAPDFESLEPELSAFTPSEILYPAPCPPELDRHLSASGVYSAPLEPDSLQGAREALTEVFGQGALRHLPELQESPGALLACGAAVKRLMSLTPGAALRHLSPPRLLWAAPALSLDEAALRNLELVRSMDGGAQGTVLSVLDRSATPMGARTLRDWLVRPSRDRAEVEARHGAVEELAGQPSLREGLLQSLKALKDLDRALSRLTLGRGAVRDLQLVKAALDLAPEFRDLLSPAREGGLLRGLSEEAGAALGDARQGGSGSLRVLKKALDLCLEAGRSQGGDDSAAVRDGCSPSLDELRALERDGRKAAAALEAGERARTGIGSLKVGYNRVFGYYLEIPRRLAGSAPPEWTRRQTLASAERYSSKELSELEGRILSAGEKREALEERILKSLKSRAAAASAGIKALSRLYGTADALRSLADVARARGWTRPRITQDDVIDIKAGRHPVVEASLPRGEAFVANDVRLSPKERILLVTGPNMAGKSTILRQTALIVILCQMGSFVPAAEARLSIRDAVFTRVGASDDLARGRSTFMVEMSETARILARATPRSLVILDEVGRGTSTFDGLAIAWAVAEYLHDRAGRGVPTLFATHYHELVELARSKPLVVNYNVAVRKWQGKVVFLRKLMPGGTSRSYGLAVAALAGLPRAVTDRAQEVLKDLLAGSRRPIRPQIRPRGLFPGPEEGREDPDALGLWAPDELDSLQDPPSAAGQGPLAEEPAQHSPAGPGQGAEGLFTAAEEEPRQARAGHLRPSPEDGLNSPREGSRAGTLGIFGAPEEAAAAWRVAAPWAPQASGASGTLAASGGSAPQREDPAEARPLYPAAAPADPAETGTAIAGPRPLVPGAPSRDEQRARLIAEISSLNTETLTPLEALNLIHALKTRAGELS
jgi:DNA mismatch repair protein MutS